MAPPLSSNSLLSLSSVDPNTFQRQIMNALNGIDPTKPATFAGRMSREWQEMLNSPSINNMKQHNIITGCATQFPDFELVMQLNEDQLTAFHAAGKANCAISLSHGGPGTGKTYFLRQCAKPALIMPNHVQVMVLSPSNTGADELVVSLHHDLVKLQEDGKAPASKYVVRVNARPTGDDSHQYMKQYMDFLDKTKRHVADLTEDEKNLLFELYLADSQVDALQKVQKSERSLKNDCFNSIAVSLGYLMLQMVGIVDDGPKLPAEYQSEFGLEFRQSFSNWSSWTSEQFLLEEVKDLINEAEFLKDLVLRSAACVVTTISNMEEANVIWGRHVRAKYILIDDCSQIDEAAFQSIISAPFTKLQGIIAVGDMYQQLSAAKPSNMVDRSVPQLKLSLQARLQGAGIESTCFREQYHMIAEISSIANALMGKNQMTDSPEVALLNRPLAQALVKFNRDRYGKSFPVVYLDIATGNPGSNIDTTKLTKYKSRYNELYIIVIIDLLVHLLQALPNAKIAYISAYDAQLQLARSAVSKMTKDGVPNVQNLTITSWDASRGRYWDIGIVDILLFERDPGFQNKHARLSTACTRWKNGLYIVATDSQLHKIKKSKSITPLHKQIRQYRYPVLKSVAAPECQYYAPGQVEFEASVETNINVTEE